MTGWLFEMLAGVRAPFWVRLLGATLALLVLPVALVWELAALGYRRMLVAYAGSVTTLHCPAGHRVEVGPNVGWVCSSCSYSFSGSGLTPCEACGEAPAWLICPCGRSTPNPFYGALRRP